MLKDISNNKNDKIINESQNSNKIINIKRKKQSFTSIADDNLTNSITDREYKEYIKQIESESLNSVLLNVVNDKSENLNSQFHSPMKGIKVIKGKQLTLYSCRSILINDLLVFYYIKKNNNSDELKKIIIIQKNVRRWLVLNRLKKEYNKMSVYRYIIIE